jgi:hypothetical protein
VPSALCKNNPVIQPTSSSSTAPGQIPGAPGRPTIRITRKHYLPAAELRRKDVAGTPDLHSLPEISYDEYDPDGENDDTSDLGLAQGKAPISLKQTESSLKQFAKFIGQSNFSACKKWEKVWVAGFLWKKHQFMIRGDNHLKQLRDGPLHRETAVADFPVNFET